jgi:hypothetical protein
MARRLPLACSLAALTVALLGVTPVGTAARHLVFPPNSVGTAQLKKNAVVSSKVLDGSLLRSDFKPGQLPSGPAGPQGAGGPQGPAGVVGAQGQPGIAGLQIVGSASGLNSNSPKHEGATCGPGKKAIAGGFQIPELTANTFNPSPVLPIPLSIVANGPTADATGWSTWVYETSAYAGNWALDVYVVCAAVAG